MAEFLFDVSEVTMEFVAREAVSEVITSPWNLLPGKQDWYVYW